VFDGAAVSATGMILVLRTAGRGFFVAD